MKALSGSGKKLTIKTKRRGDRTPIILQFDVLQACPSDWTLDSFQLVVQGVGQFQFFVEELETQLQPVSSPADTCVFDSFHITFFEFLKFTCNLCRQQ